MAKSIPWFAIFLTFSALASVGLPALNGFVGEFLILLGAWNAGLQLLTALSAFGVVFAAVYLLKMLQETIWGALDREENRALRDLDVREVCALLPLCVFMLWIGVVPRTFLEPSRPALAALLGHYQQRLATVPGDEPALAAPLAGTDEAPTFLAARSAVAGEATP